MHSIEHINVKVFARPGASLEWHSLIPVFHRWIQEQTFPQALLLDVADYAHVPAGPGMMLIGHHANISLDNRENRLGLLYNRKTAMPGTTAEKLRHSYEGAVAVARQLQEEPELLGKIAFDESDIEITINDRLLAPNTEQTWNSVRLDFQKAFAGAELQWRGNPRDLFRVAASLSPVAAG